IMLALALALGAASTIVVASGVGFRKRPVDEDGEDDEEGTSISVGWLVHTLLSFKARLARFLFAPLLRAMTARPRRRPLKERVEPRLDGAHEDDEEDEDDVEDEEDGDEEEEEDEDEDEDEIPRSKRKIAGPKRKSSEGYEPPSLSVLAAPKSTERSAPSEQMIKDNAVSLESVLEDFGVRGEIINAHPGPVVTLYELEPAPGIKSSRVIGLADDIARSMSAVSARVAVVPGRNAIGIELPNPSREKVYLRELLASDDYNRTTAKLPLCLGKTIGGHPVIVDLERMPH